MIMVIISRKISMKILGIDEAGKGPVIGPMCIGGVRIDEDRSNALKNLGVADSKKLSPKRRVQLAAQIKKYADGWFVYEVSPNQIDELRKLMSMNDIMVLAFGSVIEELPSDKIYADAADVKEERFGKRLLDNYMEKHPDISAPEVISKHRADDLYPVVSAASILAKVRRDELIEQIKVDMGVDIGSGYPSDPKTKKFLEEWYRENGSFPDIVRHSWKTAQKFIQ